MPTGKASPKKKISPAAARVSRTSKALPEKKEAKAAAKPSAKPSVKKGSGAATVKPPPKPSPKKNSKAAAAKPKPRSAPAKRVAVPAVASKPATPAAKSTVAKVKKPAAPAAPAVPKKKAAAPSSVVSVELSVKVSPDVAPEISAEAKLRDKKYAELFGVSLPKGRGVNLQGEPVKGDVTEIESWTIMQYPPRTGRLTWIYATHGLSTSRAKGKDKPTRIELAMHWRERGTQPISVLSEIANYILQSGHSLAPGDVFSESHGVHTGVTDVMLKHFIALSPEPFMPRALDLPGGAVMPLMLLGISDAELESATKVRPELADGKLVLMEALRSGGVFPVTDPRRQCLTRRRDFLRIWETAFRGIREQKK